MFLLLSKAMHACILFERYFKDFVDDILKQRMVTITYGWIFDLILCSLTLKKKTGTKVENVNLINGSFSIYVTLSYLISKTFTKFLDRNVKLEI